MYNDPNDNYSRADVPWIRHRIAYGWQRVLMNLIMGGILFYFGINATATFFRVAMLIAAGLAGVLALAHLFLIGKWELKIEEITNEKRR